MGARVNVIQSTYEGNVVEIYVDSEADIPEVGANWLSGSYVFILDTQEVKFLNSQGEWV